MDDIDGEFSREERKEEPMVLVTYWAPYQTWSFPRLWALKFIETIFVLMV